MEQIRRVKALKSQLNSLLTDKDIVKSQMVTFQKKYDMILNEIKKKEIEIKRLEETNEIKVSEHALLRYLERVKGIDISEVERKIIEPIKPLVEKLGGNGSYPGHFFSAKVKDYVVVTITVK